MENRTERYKRLAAFMLKMAGIKEAKGDRAASEHFLQQAVEAEEAAKRTE